MGGCHFGLATNNSLTLGSIESWEAKQNRGRTTKWKPAGSCLFLLCNLNRFFREKYGNASRHAACMYIQHCFSTWLSKSCLALTLWFGNHKIWVQKMDKYRNHYSQLRVVTNRAPRTNRFLLKCTDMWGSTLAGIAHGDQGAACTLGPGFTWEIQL